MIDLKALREAAEKATPGPWKDIQSRAWVVRHTQGRNDRTGSVEIARCGNFADGDLVPFNAARWRADATFIALANPAAYGPSACEKVGVEHFHEHASKPHRLPHPRIHRAWHHL